MVSVGGFGDAFLTGELTRSTNRPRGHVGAIFAEHRPIRAVDGLSEFLRQPHGVFSGVVEAIALGLYLCSDRVDLGMIVAEQDRAVAAHQVDVCIAIHVPVAATVCMMSEVGKGAWDCGGRRGVSINAAGDDCTGAFKQRHGFGIVWVHRKCGRGGLRLDIKRDAFEDIAEGIGQGDQACDLNVAEADGSHHIDAIADCLERRIRIREGDTHVGLLLGRTFARGDAAVAPFEPCAIAFGADAEIGDALRRLRHDALGTWLMKGEFDHGTQGDT